LILGTQLRRPSYNIIMINNRTLFNILTAIYRKNALPVDSIAITLLIIMGSKSVWVKALSLEKKSRTCESCSKRAILNPEKEP
jgi:hypothetical protein